jgi:hypothetical protein
MLTPQQIAALRQIADAIVDTVRETGSRGAPGGLLYIALSERGCTLRQFENLMSALIAAGRLRQDGQVYYAVEAR